MAFCHDSALSHERKKSLNEKHFDLQRIAELLSLSVIFDSRKFPGHKGCSPLNFRKIKNFEKFSMGQILKSSLSEAFLITIESWHLSILKKILSQHFNKFFYIFVGDQLMGRHLKRGHKIHISKWSTSCHCRNLKFPQNTANMILIPLKFINCKNLFMESNYEG